MTDRRHARLNEGARASVGAVELVVFLVELVLFAVLAVAGARIGDGALALGLAGALPLFAAILWGLRLAPRATRRLRYPARLIVKLALVAMAATLLAASGAAGWAVAFLVVSSAPIMLGELRERSADVRGSPPGVSQPTSRADPPRRRADSRRGWAHR